MRGACAIATPLALALALMASLSVVAGTFEACHAVQPEVDSVAQCVQIARKTAQAELVSAESIRRTALCARIAANKGTDHGAAMVFDRTVRAHQFYRQAGHDLSYRLVCNTPDADLVEAVCEADLSRERIGILRDVAQPVIPAATPATPS